MWYATEQIDQSPEARTLILLDPPLASRIHERKKTRIMPWGELPWVLGGQVLGGRKGTLLFYPTARDIDKTLQKWPELPIVIMGDESEPSSQVCLPAAIPDQFFPPGTGADVFGVTRRLHLEERPRWLYLGGYGSGRDLTTLFTVAKGLLGGQGELVLVEGLSYRAQLAPLIKNLRLSERVVLAPSLTLAELSGITAGVDVILAMSNPYRLELSWSMAAGVPIIALATDANQAILGQSALYMDDLDPTNWSDAVNQSLSSDALREELAFRLNARTDSLRLSQARVRWMEWLASLR